jgi:hypothetical protein
MIALATGKRSFSVAHGGGSKTLQIKKKIFSYSTTKMSPTNLSFEKTEICPVGKLTAEVRYLFVFKEY